MNTEIKVLDELDKLSKCQPNFYDLEGNLMPEEGRSWLMITLSLARHLIKGSVIEEQEAGTKIANIIGVLRLLAEEPADRDLIRAYHQTMTLIDIWLTDHIQKK